MINITYKGDPDSDGLYFKYYGYMGTMFMDKCRTFNVLAVIRGAIEIN